MIIDIFLIAIALSMDTFSLSLGLGTYNVTRKNKITLSLMVGLMHFFMPLLGTIIGSNIMAFFSLNSNLFLGCILIFIAINLIIDSFKNESLNYNMSLIGMFLFSFAVSIDAFSTGLALSAITESKVIAMTIFSIVSFTFTFIGLSLGSLIYNKVGSKANFLGFILLIILGIFHICKH